MSIETEGERATTAAAGIRASRDDIFAALTTAGVIVPVDAVLADVPDLIGLLSSGATVITSATIDNTAPVVGDTISAVVLATNSPTLAFQWFSDGVAIPGTSGVDYTVLPEDDGAVITYTVTASNIVNSTTATSGATEAVVFQAPTAFGTAPDVSTDENATALVVDIGALFRVVADDLLVGVTWSATGATVADPSAPFITLDRSVSGTSAVTVTATNSGGSAVQSFDLIVSATDTTPPVLSGATNTATLLGYTVDEQGTAYWMVDDNASRTKAQVKTGGGDASGSFAANGGTDTDTADMTSLSGTKYVHTMVEDAAGNQSNVVTTQINVVAADVTAPTLTPGTLTFGSTTAERPVSTDEGNGTLWRLVDGNASRTAAQVKAAGLSVPVTASGAQGAQTWTGLTASTGYNFHLMHEDTAGNQSTVSSASFTTAAAAAGVIVEQTVLGASSSSSTQPYAGSITVGSETNRAVLAFVHGYNLDSETVISGRTPPDDEPGVVTISLGGSTMAELVAPELTPAGRAWSAIYWLAAPTTGSQTFSVSCDESQRATAVTLVEMSGIAQTTPVVFTATTIKNTSGTTLAATQTFPSRTLDAAGNKMFLTAAIDTGAMALPTAIGGELLLAGQTGTLATSDVTHAVVCRDASGVIGLQMDANRRGILHMIELEAV